MSVQAIHTGNRNQVDQRKLLSFCVAKQSISEAALWTRRWTNCGDLTVIISTHLLQVQAVDVENIVKSYTSLQALLCNHAQRFVTALNGQDENLSDLFNSVDVMKPDLRGGGNRRGSIFGAARSLS